MKRIIAILLAVAIFMPIVVIASEPIGTRKNPIYITKEPKGETVKDFTGFDAITLNNVTADITVTVEGRLSLNDAFYKILDLTFEEQKGPFLDCFKVLLTAENIDGGTSIMVSTDSFKVFDPKFIEIPILTSLESVELLDGASAYFYVGINPHDRQACYLVFNNQLWFDILLAKTVK